MRDFIKKLLGNSGWFYPEYNDVVLFLQDDELPVDLREIKVFAANGMVFNARVERVSQKGDDGKYHTIRRDRS